MTVRGWCPSLFEPMQSGDGWLLRVKPFGARISADQAETLADLAPGAIELTNRGNLQLRGLTAEALPGLAEALLAAGLAWADPGAETRRNLIVPPLLGDDPAIPVQAAGHVAALEAWLAAAGPLPGKFGLVLDGGGRLPLASLDADLRLRVAPGGLELRLPGAAVMAREATPEALTRLLAAFRGTGARRMREAVRLAGAEPLLAAAGLRAEPDAALPAATPESVGLLRYPGAARGAFGLAPRFGQLDGAGLRALAGLARRFGDGSLRVSPWRSLLLALPGEAAPLRQALPAGWITDPADPWARLVACPGAAGCASGGTDTRADAAILLRQGALPAAGLLHVSGCAKGCAHPAAAAAVLVGQAGRYALVRHGRAGDPPQRQGLTLAEVAAELAER